MIKLMQIGQKRSLKEFWTVKVFIWVIYSLIVNYLVLTYMF